MGHPLRVSAPALKHDEHADAHGDHDDDHADELAPDEPRTPGWLTALGGALFLLAGVYWIATRPAPRTLEQMQETAAPAGSAAAEGEPPAPPPPMPAPNAMPPLHLPAPAGSARPDVPHPFPRPH